LEGIMGQRAMRLRFMDMEPDEVFAQAETGDARCVEFTKALAPGAGGRDSHQRSSWMDPASFSSQGSTQVS
jgi:hypothetical protein